MHWITDKMFKLVDKGWKPPTDWTDFVEWRPREYNKRAVYLRNQALDTGGSFDYIDPHIELFRSMNPNWKVYSDGGCRQEGTSAYAWMIYAVIDTGVSLHLFNVAFGYVCVEQNQSSFIVEAQGLDKALEILDKVVGTSVV